VLLKIYYSDEKKGGGLTYVARMRAMEIV